MSKNMSRFVFTMALGTFVVVLDNTIMNVSITALVQDLHTTVSGVQTAVALNALMMAAFVLLGGKLGDIIGLRRTFLTGAVLYIAGSTLASFANNLNIFILGWCLIQGVGAALMMPNVQSLIRTHVQGDARAKAYGTIGGVNALGTAVGPIIGGFLTAYFSWRWAFRLEVFTLIGLLFMNSVIPKDMLAKVKPSLDWFGAVLQAIAMLGIVTGIMLVDQFGFIFAKAELPLGPFTLTPFGLSPALVIIGLGVISLLAFTAWERRREAKQLSTLLDLNLFINRAFNNSLIVRSLQIAIFVGLLFTIPLFLQVTFGLDAFQTGIIMLPFSLTVVLAIPPVMRFAQKYTPQLIVRLGFILSLGGSLVLMWLIQSSTEPRNLIPGLIIFALGMAMIASQMANFVMSSVKGSQTAEAAGVMGTFEQIGNSVGVAILGTLLTSALTNSLLNVIPESLVLSTTEQQALTNYVETNQVQIVSDDQVFAAANEKNVTDPVSTEISQLYSLARTNAFQATTLTIAFFCLIGLILSAHLPKKPLADLAAAES